MTRDDITQIRTRAMMADLETRVLYGAVIAVSPATNLIMAETVSNSAARSRELADEYVAGGFPIVRIVELAVVEMPAKEEAVAA